MKKLLPLLFIVSSFTGLAQPVIHNAENYTQPLLLKMGKCFPAPAGNSGASQVWDFSGLAVTGIYVIETSSVPTNNPYPVADHIITDSFFYSAATALYMNNANGHQELVADARSGYTTNSYAYAFEYDDPKVLLKRPMAYGDFYSDSFAYHSTGSISSQTCIGKITSSVDGYGTIILPYGTFHNVVRVRTVSNGVVNLGVFHDSVVSYKWYNDTILSPLLTIDTILSSAYVFSSPPTIAKLLLWEAPTSISQTSVTPNADYTASLNNSTLYLHGDFQTGQTYEISLVSIDGKTIFKQDAIPASGHISLDTDAGLPNGIYLIHIRNKKDLTQPAVIKVTKQ